MHSHTRTETWTQDRMLQYFPNTERSLTTMPCVKDILGTGTSLRCLWYMFAVRIEFTRPMRLDGLSEFQNLRHLVLRWCCTTQAATWKWMDLQRNEISISTLKSLVLIGFNNIPDCLDRNSNGLMDDLRHLFPHLEEVTLLQCRPKPTDKPLELDSGYLGTISCKKYLIPVNFEYSSPIILHCDPLFALAYHFAALENDEDLTSARDSPFLERFHHVLC